MKADRQQDRQAYAQGRLLAQPTQPVESVPFGLQPLGISNQGDGFLYVPPSYQASQPAPLVLMLHGAGGDAENGLVPFLRLADKAGLILVAPDSRRRTWDILLGEYGADIAFIDQALKYTFNRCAIDKTRIGIEGFSDGASYALSVGITNGDLFTHVIAFSPGFMAPTAQRGLPHIFISHGIGDTVLPINKCSRKIVPQLQRAKYEVLYHEFNGSHTVPDAIAREALDWFIKSENEKTLES